MGGRILRPSLRVAHRRYSKHLRQNDEDSPTPISAAEKLFSRFSSTNSILWLLILTFCCYLLTGIIEPQIHLTEWLSHDTIFAITLAICSMLVAITAFTVPYRTMRLTSLGLDAAKYLFKEGWPFLLSLSVSSLVAIVVALPVAEGLNSIFGATIYHPATVSSVALFFACLSSIYMVLMLVKFIRTLSAVTDNQLILQSSLEDLRQKTAEIAARGIAIEKINRMITDNGFSSATRYSLFFGNEGSHRISVPFASRIADADRRLFIKVKKVVYEHNSSSPEYFDAKRIDFNSNLLNLSSGDIIAVLPQDTPRKLRQQVERVVLDAIDFASDHTEEPTPMQRLIDSLSEAISRNDTSSAKARMDTIELFYKEGMKLWSDLSKSSESSEIDKIVSQQLNRDLYSVIRAATDSESDLLLDIQKLVTNLASISLAFNSPTQFANLGRHIAFSYFQISRENPKRRKSALEQFTTWIFISQIVLSKKAEGPLSADQKDILEKLYTAFHQCIALAFKASIDLGNLDDTKHIISQLWHLDRSMIRRLAREDRSKAASNIKVYAAKEIADITIVAAGWALEIAKRGVTKHSVSSDAFTTILHHCSGFLGSSATCIDFIRRQAFEASFGHDTKFPGYNMDFASWDYQDPNAFRPPTSSGRMPSAAWMLRGTLLLAMMSRKDTVLTTPSVGFPTIRRADLPHLNAVLNSLRDDGELRAATRKDEDRWNDDAETISKALEDYADAYESARREFIKTQPINKDRMGFFLNEVSKGYELESSFISAFGKSSSVPDEHKMSVSMGVLGLAMDKGLFLSEHDVSYGGLETYGGIIAHEEDACFFSHIMCLESQEFSAGTEQGLWEQIAEGILSLQQCQEVIVFVPVGRISPHQLTGPTAEDAINHYLMHRSEQEPPSIKYIMIRSFRFDGLVICRKTDFSLASRKNVLALDSIEPSSTESDVDPRVVVRVRPLSTLHMSQTAKTAVVIYEKQRQGKDSS